MPRSSAVPRPLTVKVVSDRGPAALTTRTRERVVSCAAPGFACLHWTRTPLRPLIDCAAALAATSIGACGTSVLILSCPGGLHPMEASRARGAQERPITR